MDDGTGDGRRDVRFADPGRSNDDRRSSDRLLGAFCKCRFEVRKLSIATDERNDASEDGALLSLLLEHDRVVTTSSDDEPRFDDGSGRSIETDGSDLRFVEEGDPPFDIT